MFDLRIVAQDGRTMSSAEIKEYLLTETGNELGRKIDDAVGGLSCPVHGKQPTITIALSAELKNDVSVTACCDAAQAAAAKALQSAL